jgi:hypothetical protein
MSLLSSTVTTTESSRAKQCALDGVGRERRRAEDQLALLRHLPHPARAVEARRDRALLAADVDARHLALVAEEGVEVRSVVDRPELDAAIEGGGEELVGGVVAEGEAGHEVFVATKCLRARARAAVVALPLCSTEGFVQMDTTWQSACALGTFLG